MAIFNAQKRMVLRRKLRVLRNLANSKFAKKSSIIRDTFLYKYKYKLMKLQLEALQKQYLYLIQHIQEVKVEKIEKGLIQVRVRCLKKRKDLLVTILEVFEKIGMNVVHARVSCNHNIFGMEAIAQAHDHDQDQDKDFREVSEAILKAIHIQSDDQVEVGVGTCKSVDVPVLV